MNYSYAKWIHMLNKSFICCQWQSLSWLTLWGCSPKQYNFPLQFIAPKATWERGLKCILDLDIPLPNTVEWLPTCGNKHLNKVSKPPRICTHLPPSVLPLLTAFALHCSLLDYCESPQLTVFSVTFRLFTSTPSALLLFTLQLAITHCSSFKIQLTHSFNHSMNICQVPVNYQTRF